MKNFFTVFFIILIVSAGRHLSAQGQPLPVQVMRPTPQTQLIQEWSVPGNGDPVPAGKKFKPADTDWRLYTAIGFLLIFAICRRLFQKFYSDLVSLMFRTTVKSRQIKEQLQNTPLPSIVFNGLFILSGSLFTSLMLSHRGYEPGGNIWTSLVLCMAGLSAVYLGKFLVLKLFGWLTGNAQITGTYIFIVFYINKIAGILLVPVVLAQLLLWPQIVDILIVVALFLLFLLLFYRYILAWPAARTMVQVPRFHFFLYICAVELAPLLLVYRVAVQFLGYQT